MESSNDYMYRCIDIINADKNISETTLILMFQEFKKKIEAENNEGWIKYDWNDRKTHPPKYGKYLIFREKCSKTHFEVWNGNGWASSNNDCTHYRSIEKPK